MLKLTAMILEPEPPTQVRNFCLNFEQWMKNTGFPALSTPSNQIDAMHRLSAYCAQQIAAFESSQGTVRQSAGGAHTAG
jgi:hypothetical protein